MSGVVQHLLGTIKLKFIFINMSEKNVKIGFKVDGVDGYITDLNELNKVLNQATTSTDKLSNSQKKNTTSTKNLEKETDKLNKTTKKGKSSTDELSNSLSSLPGPLGQVGSGLKNAKSGVENLSTAFKVLLANPILLTLTLVAGALSILTAAFFSTKDGTDAAERASAAFKATLNQVRDIILDTDEKLGGFLSKLTKFTNIFSIISESSGVDFTLLTDEAKEAAELTGELQRIRDEQRNLNVERAETNKQISAARLAARDENLTLEERTALLEDAATKEDDLLQRELDLERQRLAALQALAAQSDSSVEDLDEIADAQVKIANLEERSNNKRKEVGEEIKRLGDEARRKEEADAAAAQAERDAANADKEAKSQQEAALLQAQSDLEKQLRLERLDGEEKEIQVARDKAEKRLEVAGENAELRKQIEQQLADEIDEINNRYDQKEIDDARVKQETIQGLINQSIDNQLEDKFRQAEAELKIQEDKLVAELEAEGATAEQIQEVRNNFSKKREKLAKEESKFNIDLKKKEEAAKLDTISSAFSAISQIAGEQSAVGKAAAVAAATIDTYQAANNALANTPAPPPFPQIAAGVAVASGLLNVRKILQTKTPGPDISSPPPPSVTNVPPPDLNAGFRGLNEPGGTITPGFNNNQPIRAYVVAEEVTSNQNANQQIENLSRL